VLNEILLKFNGGMQFNAPSIFEIISQPTVIFRSLWKRLVKAELNKEGKKAIYKET